MQEPRTELRQSKTFKPAPADALRPSCKAPDSPSDRECWVEMAMSAAISRIEGEI